MRGVTPLARALVIGLTLWVAAIVAAPIAIGSRHRLIAAPAAAVYAAAGLVCHQRPERSFSILHRQLAVCARCTGLYASALAGALIAFASPRRHTHAGTARWLILFMAIPTGLSWGIERVGIAHIGNATRALLALPLGAVAAWVVVSLMREHDGQDAR
jgi:uncharacterized membrane protein